MTAAPQRPMTGREWGLLTLLSLLWGGSFLFVGVAVKELPPLTLVTLRVGIAAAILWTTAPILGAKPPRTIKAAAAVVVLGFANNALPFSLIAWGQTHLPSGLASILNAATPLFTVLAAHVLTKEEKLSDLKLAGTIAGLAGVAALIGPDLLTGAGANVWAELAVLAAALSYALAAIFARRMPALGLKPIDVAAGQATAAALMLAPVALTLDRPWALPMPGVATIGCVLAIAVLSTALAYVVYFRILAGAGATNVLLVTLLVPATSVALGALFLGERLMARQLLGYALIAIGLAFIDGRLPRRLARWLTDHKGAAAFSTPHAPESALTSPDGDGDQEAGRCR
jgi:drug/metabolite transporter (DMT)-like permease